jgi:hypothetical protein
VGNPITALNDVSLVNQYRPGVQTIFQRGNIDYSRPSVKGEDSIVILNILINKN